jgi:hypothetical protein
MKLAFPSLPPGLLSPFSRSNPHTGADARPARKSFLALAPRWLTVVDHEWKTSGYCIRYHWDGRCSLEPSPIPEHESSLVILDQALPYRRKLQGFPANERSRRALLKAAVDEFPLPPGQVNYALGIRGHDGYLYALPHEYRQKLLSCGVSPAAILVAQESLAEPALLAVLQDLERYGTSFAIGGAQRYISRRAVISTLLVIVLSAQLLLIAVLALFPNPLNSLLEWERTRLTQEAGDLPRKHSNTNIMLGEQQAIAKLKSSPEAQLPAELSRLISITPSGHSIQRIEYKDGLLKIAGTGESAAQWFANAGFPSARVSIESIGPQRLFRAELSLENRK